MNDSIITLVKDNPFLKKWLYKHALLQMLKSEEAKAKEMVKNESNAKFLVNRELTEYCGNLAEINSALQTIHNLRDEENKIKQEITNAKEELQSEKINRQNLIKYCIIASIAVAIIIIILIIIN